MEKKLAYFGAHFNQAHCTIVSNSIKQVALNLPAPTSGRALLRLRLLFIIHYFFRALWTEKSSIRARFTIGSDCKALAAKLTISKLAWQRLTGLLFHHFSRKGIIVFIGRFSYAPSLTSSEVFALLDFCKCGRFLSLAFPRLFGCLVGMLLLLGSSCSIFRVFIFSGLLFCFPYTSPVIVVNLGSGDVVGLVESNISKSPFEDNKEMT